MTSTLRRRLRALEARIAPPVDEPVHIDWSGINDAELRELEPLIRRLAEGPALTPAEHERLEQLALKITVTPAGPSSSGASLDQGQSHEQ